MNLTKQPSKSTKKKTIVKAKANGEKSQPNKERQSSRVAVSAYYKAQARGFKPGNEVADWLAAEAEENQ